MSSCRIEVREKEELQRIEKMKGDMLDRFGVEVLLGIKT